MDITGLKKMGKVMVAPIIAALLLVYPMIGKSEFVPSITAAYNYDDNVFREQTGEVSDSFYAISPGLAAEWILGKHNLTAGYNGTYAYYNDRSDEDYKDHTLGADLLLDLTPKFNLDLQADTKRGHESRGSAGTTPGVSAFPNKTEEDRLFAGLSYGRRSAQAQLGLDIETRDLRYTNNDQQSRDRDTDTLTGRVFYNLGPKTSLIFEAINSDIDYLNPGSRNRDSTERYYHLGVKWEATNKTTGEVKVGRFKKDFESASENGARGTSVAASVLWEPQTYSRVTFGASRKANETTTTDSFFTSSIVSAAWEHELNQRLRFNANISEETDDYSGTREDDLSNYGLGLKYRIGLFDVGLSYSYSERKSNTADASYEDNVYMLSVGI